MTIREAITAARDVLMYVLDEIGEAIDSAETPAEEGATGRALDGLEADGMRVHQAIAIGLAAPSHSAELRGILATMDPDLRASIERAIRAAGHGHLLEESSDG